MKELRGRHAGQTATIVGKGPSILRLRARDFGPGPVITLNHAILVVRALHLEQPVYSMQKDGCVDHHNGAAPVPITRCVCPSPRMPAPVPPEVVLLSVMESSHCHASYPYRHLFDCETDFGLPWNSMSAPVAVRIAAHMGCTGVVLLGMDSVTKGSYTRVENGRLIPSGRKGYRRAGLRAIAYAKEAGMAVTVR